MSAALELARSATPTGGAAPPPGAPEGAGPPPLARRLVARIRDEWLPLAAWSIGRTGRQGLVGIALLFASAVFLFSTYVGVADEVEGLRADLAAERRPARTAAADRPADPAAVVRALPARNDMPVILHQLFAEATRARLAVDTGRYEVNAAKESAVVRHQITFPVTGPYPQIRAFVDGVLAAMPSVALDELVLERKTITDADVDAQIRLTAFTVPGGVERPTPRAGSSDAELARAPAQPSAVPATPARAAPDRVVLPAFASSLFAQHSWVVIPPAPPPAAPPPPPEPVAPPLPFSFLGSYTPEGQPTVYFLGAGDRVIDAHVGDRVEGVYQFESAGGGQLVFVYTPLNTRQFLAGGASQ